ncbi:MAG TPA: hypothetical protein VNL73_04365 [Verrucomicrobiae bacterium]|nr:hypothetical protein [Verrucomicrobiae bacterium]
MGGRSKGKFAILPVFLLLLSRGEIFAQKAETLSVTVDTLTVKALPFLIGKVDSADLRLVAKAVLEGDSIKHGWLLHFSPIELRAEEQYGFFPNIRFFRFFTPDYKVVPGHVAAIDREKGKAYLIYQSGAADDLGELVLDQGIKLDSEAVALEYFMEVLQIRGYQPALILDTIVEIRQFLHYREKSAGLKLSELPPLRRIYRSLWRDKNFLPFRRGKLSAERDSRCGKLETAWAGEIAAPFAYFQKGQFFIQLYLARTRKIFDLYKFSAFVSPEGQVSYTVVKLE